MGIQDRKEGRIFNMFRGLGPQNGICDELFPTFEKEENLLSNMLYRHQTWRNSKMNRYLFLSTPPCTGVLAIRSFVFCGFAIRGFLKHWKCPHFVIEPNF